MNGAEIVGILITITAISSYINYRYLKLPKTIGLTLITLLLSLIVAGLGKIGCNIDPIATQLLDGIGFNDTFLHGMLGFLIFAASLHVNAMELAKHRIIVGMLATVSVVLSTFIIGACTFAMTQFLGIEIPIEYCLVFGALISPTDPITTLSILKTAQAPKSLEMKIIGESLFNDGMGIVLFIMLLGLAAESKTLTLTNATWFFMQQGVGGLILGLIMGWVAARILRSIDNFEVATLFTLAVVSGGYTFAQSVAQVSGAICMAVAGLMVGSLLQNGNMSKKTMQRLDSFWKLLDGVLNAILFVVIGLEFLTLHFSAVTLLAAVWAIIICILARWISVVVPVGWLAVFRKYDPNVVMIMTWGGLRGGISIALALTVPDPARDFILAITYAVVLFSITVQGLSLRSLVCKLSKREAESNQDFELQIPALNLTPALAMSGAYSTPGHAKEFSATNSSPQEWLNPDKATIDALSMFSTTFDPSIRKKLLRLTPLHSLSKNSPPVGLGHAPYA